MQSLHSTRSTSQSQRPLSSQNWESERPRVYPAGATYYQTPKSETRNSNSETHTRGGKGKKPKTARFGTALRFWPLNLGFVSDFGFRVSDSKPAQTGGASQMQIGRASCRER